MQKSRQNKFKYVQDFNIEGKKSIDYRLFKTILIM